MKTNEKMIGEVRVVWVDGPNLDAAAVAALRAQFLPTVERRPLLLCVEEVDFIDSIGMSLFRRLRSLAGDDNFAIAGVNDRLKSCLDRFPAAAWPNAYATREAAQAARDEAGSFHIEESEIAATEQEDVSIVSEESWEHQET